MGTVGRPVCHYEESDALPVTAHQGALGAPALALVRGVHTAEATKRGQAAKRRLPHRGSRALTAAALPRARWARRGENNRSVSGTTLRLQGPLPSKGSRCKETGRMFKQDP